MCAWFHITISFRDIFWKVKTNNNRLNVDLEDHQREQHEISYSMDWVIEYAILVDDIQLTFKRSGDQKGINCNFIKDHGMKFHSMEFIAYNFISNEIL